MHLPFQLRRDLKKEGRLADSRFTSNQNHGTRNDSATEDEVEFCQSGLPTRLGSSNYFAERSRLRNSAAFAQALVTCDSTGGTLRCACGTALGAGLFHEGIPLAANVAASGPARMLRPAIGAAVYASRLGGHCCALRAE